MSEDFDIDELLNGYIDDELSARQSIEAQRLIVHNQRVAKRHRELAGCKKLINSLPRQQAPANLVEDINAALERKTLLGRSPDGLGERAGARSLLVRRVAAAAAMVALVAVLGAVIYTIVAPQAVKKAPAAKAPLTEAVPGRTVLTEESGGEPVVAMEHPAEQSDFVLPRYIGRVELKTDEPQMVAAFLNKTLEQQGLGSAGLAGSARILSVVCSRDELYLFLSESEDIWSRVKTARFFVGAEEGRESVVINDVTVEQIAKVAGQNGFEESIKVAGDFAVLNAISGRMPGRQLLAASDGKAPDMIKVPKPVLTSNEITAERAEEQTGLKDKVYFKIVITASGR